MRVSLNWLKEYVDIRLTPAELGERLTMAGLEVEAIEPIGQSLEGVVAGRILDFKRHPDADRLWLCQVDNGREQVQVVCGAPNLAKGQITPLALPGTTLPNGMIVKESKIRGERSAGMLLAEDEMGLSEDHSGIMVLGSDLKPGHAIADLNFGDWVLELNITPNRPDWVSIIGTAREIAALTGQRIKRPQIVLREEDTPIAKLAQVTLEDSLGCPRYAAGMIRGIEIKPSPFWMRQRLFACGLRSINNIVDVTNYILLETGQPLHAFDYEQVAEKRIVVRRATEGESFTTLDSKVHALNREHLMICDGRRSVALAGIMGGLNSEISAGTKNILIESAYFNPLTIRRGAKRLGISTEASYRFERGIDIDGVVPSLRRALMLMQQLAGGKVAKGIIDQYPKILKKPAIRMRTAKANALLGTDINASKMAEYFRALELDVLEERPESLLVQAPGFRVDLEREVDLIEEVGRLEGYDRIPVTFPPIRPVSLQDSPEMLLNNRIRPVMTGLGFDEIITYSFIAPEAVRALAAPEKSPLNSLVHLRNPLTVEQSVLRSSLLPGLLATIKTNVAYGEHHLKIFELGKVFIAKKADELPEEKNMLVTALTGLAEEKAWHSPERKVDFYDIKGTAEALLGALGFENLVFRNATGLIGYDAQVCAEAIQGDAVLAQCGLVSENLLQFYDLKEANIFLLEMDLDSINRVLPEKKRFESFVNYPAVYRDITLLVAKQTAGAQVSEIIKKQGGELVESVRLFDLFADSAKLQTDEKALSFRICYRSRQRTLEGKEINQLHEKIILKLGQETGGRLREG
ncbi:MAG: phenylalanine--tRNA ligase subunit beta [Desulfobacteraceae bacterium]|nr:MAG: phenylalanine--tRNA ligase subunit beta [Desulfobacteraceae bacterium]